MELPPIVNCVICRKLCRYTTADGRCEECVGKDAFYYASNGSSWTIVQAKSNWSAKSDASVHIGPFIIELRMATGEEVRRFQEEMGETGG